MNIRSQLYILGWLVAAFGLIMLLPAAAATTAKHTGAFVEAGALTSFFGVALVLMNRTKNIKLNHRDGFMLTVLIWSVLSLLGALPFYITGAMPRFIPALFESISGLTTTGATVLSGLDKLDPSLLWWRSLLQWLGGMGIVVLAIAVLPFLQIGGMQLYKSEMAGVVKSKLHPRLKDTAKTLWLLYVGLTAACALAYFMCGMSAFDALNHAMTTVATGGFSTHDTSIGHFNAPAIEMVAIFFMLLGAVNFSLHYVAFFKGEGAEVYTRNDEFRLFISLLIVAMLVVGSVLLFQGLTTEKTLHEVVFNSVAVITTTGYGTADYGAWPIAAQLVFFFLMFVGGCSGSTTGGMKVLRIMVLLKQGGREIFRLIHPRSLVAVKVDSISVPHTVVEAVWSFAALYGLMFILIAFSISLFGFDFLTSFAAAGATLTGLGPGLGQVGPAATYAFMPDGALAILCFSMLLGRLEVLTVLVLLTPFFWRR